MKKFLIYIPTVLVLAFFIFFSKSQGDFFGINVAFGYGGGGGGGGTMYVLPILGINPVVVTGGNTVTSRNISLLYNVSNASMVAISENPSFIGGIWKTFSVSDSFTLSEGYGVKTLYFKFRSSSGAEVLHQILVTYVVGTETFTPPPTPLPTPTPGAPATVGGFVIPFRSGLTSAQRQSIINLVDSGRMFSQTDAKNYAYAIGEANWQQFVGTNPKLMAPVQPIITTTSKFIFTNYLYLGSIGTEVRALQQKLKDLGYFTYPYITGYFGSVTKSAVVLFQKAYNLTPYPGWVGVGTRSILNSL